MLHAYVNEKKWAELPKHYQVAFETACGDANQWMQAKYDAQNPPALRRLVASGTQLRAFPRAVLEAAEKASYEVYDEMSAKSPHFKRIYPEWRKFRDEQFLWFRVAEQSYDNYSFNSRVGQPASKPAAKGAKKS
jgi:TRAP-type mannitol/chloroaromatic compound transport system substrate-binding protein